MAEEKSLSKESQTLRGISDDGKPVVSSYSFSDTSQIIQPETTTIPLKILYTLHGIETQKYVVKPANPVKVRVFRALGLGTVEMKACLHAIKDASPDFSAICDTHEDEYAVYSVDYAEDCLPLQSHGRVSQSTMIEATGKLGSSKLLHEQLELLIHLLPVRKPNELIAEYQPFPYMVGPLESSSNATMSGIGSHSELNDPMIDIPIPKVKPPLPQFQFTSTSLANSNLLHSLPALPPPTQIPASLTSDGTKQKSEPILPSSPPYRARPAKILSGTASLIGKTQALHSSSIGATSVKRANSENSTSKRRKASSPKAEGESQCGNCGVAAASTWRRVESSDGKKELLCNACGLYYKAKHVMRPSSLWEKVRTRGDYDTAHINGINAPKANSNGQGAALTNYQNSISNPRSTVLWSQEAVSHLLNSENDVDISDRLLDNPQKADCDQMPLVSKLGNIENTGNRTKFQEEPKSENHIVTEPSTPPRKQHFTLDHQAPDSIQKFFDITTPDQKNQILMPGSGSASKWLRQVMNPASFEDFLKSPTPRKNRTANELAILTSSPPTSSNLFSEISDWNNMYPTQSPGTSSGFSLFPKQGAKELASSKNAASLR